KNCYWITTIHQNMRRISDSKKLNCRSSIRNGGRQTVLPAAASRTEAIKQHCRPRYPKRRPSKGVAGRGIPNGGHQTVLPAAVSKYNNRSIPRRAKTPPRCGGVFKHK